MHGRQVRMPSSLPDGAAAMSGDGRIHSRPGGAGSESPNAASAGLQDVSDIPSGWRASCRT